MLLLDNSQIGHLLEVLNCALFEYEVKKLDSIEDENIEPENIKIQDAFIVVKNIEGYSEKSLKYYRITIETMLTTIRKGVLHTKTEDLREYVTN